MTKRMLIDSTNAEETRVVVLDGNRLDEFDLETSTKHQLKGNIYLAKVVRVEPSLQAAFIEYGGNRHGFLAFGEIHPDYYQIPVADRKRLLEAQEQEAREDEEAEERAAAVQDGRGNRAREPEALVASENEPGSDAAAEPLSAASNDHPAEVDTDAEGAPHTGQEILGQEIAEQEVAGQETAGREIAAQPAAMVNDVVVAPEAASLLFPVGDDALVGETPSDVSMAEAVPSDAMTADAVVADTVVTGAMVTDTASGETSGGGTDEAFTEGSAAEETDAPEQIGGENDTEDARRATPRFLRHYKIQEVIRRRQILLIQVVKEERGSKGAALTTYISLAGRFSVLMPNSPRGGGISRKITSASDRRRLKEVTAELDLPRGMGLIVRTAGANRPKPEILRDCEYLLNQWDQIRELTMKSMAPALIYEEASLIKRAIRDVYSRDVDDILVDGEQGWRAARDFMRMLMPTHARKVQLWKEPQPLFAKAQVEQQLEGMLQPTVQLRSGGYLVINQTEALVAIDVNSGRSTRERGIEETALKTNLEAAEEAARQLRLRDLAGLIVIDFIDMESRRNVAAVERKLKDALKHDRARIQVGGISHFGLLEMSRQRLRPSLAETNFVVCAHCGGTGHVRSTESAALVALRAIEDEGGRRRAAEINVTINSATALYILNHKRQRLTEIEARYGMLVTFVSDETLMPPQLRIEKIRAQTVMDAPPPISQLAPPEPFEDPDEIETEAELEEAEDDTETGSDEVVGAVETGASADGAGDGERKGRRRRRRRGRREDGASMGTATDEDGEPGTMPVAEETVSADETGADEKDANRETGADDEPMAEGERAPVDDGEAAAGREVAGDGSADAEDGERRRRGRRGGRRRRREGGEGEAAPFTRSEDEEAAAEPMAAPPAVPVVPAYAGPTPANPFGGTSAFDIFDAIEQAEEQRLLQPKPVPQAQPEPAAESAPEAASESEPPVPQPTPDTAATLAPELVSQSAEPKPELASELIEAPMVMPAPEAMPEPASEAVAGPAIQPVVIGSESEPAEKKRGWWRR